MFYDDGNPSGRGLNDFAVIGGFSLEQSDRIRLSGESKDYFLEDISLEEYRGTGIFWTGDSSSGELIGLIQNLLSSNFNLEDKSQFRYVGT